MLGNRLVIMTCMAVSIMSLAQCFPAEGELVSGASGVPKTDAVTTVSCIDGDCASAENTSAATHAKDASQLQCSGAWCDQPTDTTKGHVSRPLVSACDQWT